jgi:DnaA-homolog protein
MEQLPLGVRLRAAATFEQFHVGPNAQVVSLLEARALRGGGAPLWLWGAHGSGRTHLLQAVCARATTAGLRSGYLPLAEAWPQPDMLIGLEQLDVICLDDVDRVSHDREWAGRLFTLYNACHERGRSLVFAASGPPAGVEVALGDLASRFGAAIVFQLRALDDAEQADALQRRARALGIELPDETLLYLQRRLPRDLPSLCEALDRLDAAALSQQRRLTVPFVRSVLDLTHD